MLNQHYCHRPSRNVKSCANVCISAAFGQILQRSVVVRDQYHQSSNFIYCNLTTVQEHIENRLRNVYFKRFLLAGGAAMILFLVLHTVSIAVCSTNSSLLYRKTRRQRFFWTLDAGGKM